MLNKDKGVYVGALLNQSSLDELMHVLRKYIKDNIVDEKDIHTTIMYSKTFFNYNTSCCEFKNNSYRQNVNYKAIFDKLVKFDKGALVIKLISPDLQTRHEQLMLTPGASYDYDKYIPHITISYNSSEDIDALNKILIPRLGNIVFQFNIEYAEELKEEWADDKRK